MKPALNDTRHSLLLRLPDPHDIAAWDQFVTIYQPLVFRLARSKGFQEADAHDIVQEVLLAVAKAIDRWDPNPAKGRFRDWLFRIARNLMINFLTRRKYQPFAGSENISELIDSQPQATEFDAEATREFELEYRREQFWLAADKVRQQVMPHTWEAFRLTAIEEVPIAQVAKQLNMKEGSVVVARCRVLARLRNAVADLEPHTAEEQIRKL